MNYHNEMMNIREKRLDSQFPTTDYRRLYKEGHRDARHAAAEIALKADKRIEELENALRACLYAINSEHKMSIDIIVQEVKELLENKQ